MTAQAGAGIKIGLSIHSKVHARWEQDVAHIQEQARQHGAQLLLENASSSSIRQNQQCEKLLADGVQALIITPQDGMASAKAVEMANARGIPVIAYDRMILNCDLPLFVGLDVPWIGEILGRYAIQHAPRGQYIILDGDEKDNNAVVIRQARQKVLQPAIESGQIQVVHESWVPGWSSSLAWQYTHDALQKAASPACVLTTSDILAEGAFQAIHDAQIRTPVVITGQDADLNAVVRILRGQQTMSIYKPFQSMAKAVVECAIAMATKQPTRATRVVHNGKQNVPSFLITDLPVVEKHNVVEVVTGPNGIYTLQQICDKLPQNLWPAGAAALVGR